MNRSALRCLKALMETSTPSGWEDAGQEVLANYMSRYADRITRDVHGNVHAVINPTAPIRVMLAGHCDEIGLMVQHIDDMGYLYMSAIGGVHLSLLPGERVQIHTERGIIPGVVGVKPIHLLEEKEREQAATKLHDMWVDIGASSRKDAQKAVALGDVATIDTGWRELRNNRVTARGFDDRIGAFVVADVLRHLKDTPLKVAVHAISTVQEEVGPGGAHTAAFQVAPHVGIACDVGFASDYPSMNEKMIGRAELGRGPLVHCGPTYNRKLLAFIQKAASRTRIAVQIQPEPRGKGTDAYAMQMARGGAAVALISVPSRYMHSPVEVISLDDVTNAVRLIAETVVALQGTESFVYT